MERFEQYLKSDLVALAKTKGRFFGKSREGVVLFLNASNVTAQDVDAFVHSHGSGRLKGQDVPPTPDQPSVDSVILSNGIPLANADDRVQMDIAADDIVSCRVVKAYRSRRYFVTLKSIGREVSPILSTCSKELQRAIKAKTTETINV